MELINQENKRLVLEICRLAEAEAAAIALVRQHEATIESLERELEAAEQLIVASCNRTSTAIDESLAAIASSENRIAAMEEKPTASKAKVA